MLSDNPNLSRYDAKYKNMIPSLVSLQFICFEFTIYFEKLMFLLLSIFTRVASQRNSEISSLQNREMGEPETQYG